MTLNEEELEVVSTRVVNVKDLDENCTLVGEAGGRATVYDTEASGLVPGLWAVRTEHGELLPDPDAEVEVEDETAGFLAAGALTMVHARSEFSADDDYFALPGTRSIDEAAAALPPSSATRRGTASWWR